MAELLKDVYNKSFLEGFGRKINSVYNDFDIDKFVSRIMDEAWEQLPLKARMNKIALILGQLLPNDYRTALDVLYSIEKTCIGFPYLFLPEFVAIYGQAEQHWELSMNALERFTQGSSAEFAIRPFLLKEPERVMRKMEEWSKHLNEHVRRLSSEGCRPRLPWGVSLPMFKKDPAPVLVILEKLKEDPSLYVRKSVANNLNDIAKDNPEAVLDTAQKWIGVHRYTDWILRQGCRTLVRKGNSRALKLFGYAGISDNNFIETSEIKVEPDKIKIGDRCEILYSLTLCQGSPRHLRIEYAIDFIKSKGKLSRKLFLLSDKTTEGGKTLKGTHLHSFADLTVRRHYPGIHKIFLTVNGQVIAQTHLNLE